MKIDWSAFQESLYDFLGHVTILSKDEGRVRLEMYDAQRYFFDEIFDGLRHDIHWFVIGKGRQLGITTACLLFDIFYSGAIPNIQAGVIFDSDGNKEKFRKILGEMIKDLPSSHALPIEQHNRQGITFKNGNMLDYLVAGTKRGAGNLGRSRALNYCHACVSPDTPVIVENGSVRQIRDVVIGDTVLTHTGAPAKVIAVVPQKNTKGKMIKITPWYGQALSFSGEHKIPTARGLVLASDIRKDDLLVMPIRPITEDVCSDSLPKSINKSGRNCLQSAGSGAQIQLSSEVGFAVGYYLAEGCIIHQWSTGGPSGIRFGRHRNETHYADRAIAGIRPWTSGSRKTVDRDESLTSTDEVYGAALASWLSQTFGEKDGKHIPDAVFTWGKDFCRGLLDGLLSGDGSKCGSVSGGDMTNQVGLVSTRSSLALQARDLAASLGFGWGAVSYQPDRQRYGKPTKPAWTVNWYCGDAAALAAMIGASVFPIGAHRAMKYEIKGNVVYLKIRSIEEGDEPDEIWDISVDHEDHTFRTPFMSIGNSECAYYGDADAVEAFKDVLSEIYEFRLYLWESTGNGYNLFYDLWEDAVADELTKRAIFVTWWRKRTYSYRKGTQLFRRYGWPELSKEEAEAADEVRRTFNHKITMEQWAWYRHRSDPRAVGDHEEISEDERREVITQEHPHTPEQMFRGTGTPFIPNQYIAPALQRAEKALFKAYMYYLGDDVTATKIEPTRFANKAQLKVWQEPDPNGVYVVAADTAYGISDEGDQFCAQVIRCYADRIVQVAEFCDRSVQPYQFAWVLLHLCGWYENCRWALELNGSGEAVMTEFRNLKTMLETGRLAPKRFDTASPTDQEIENENSWRNMLSKVRQYMWHRADSLTGGGYNLQFKTTLETKFTIMTQLSDRFILGQLEINSVPCLQEMRTLRKDGRSIKAETKRNDDRPVTLALGARAYIDMERSSLVAGNRTFAIESAKAQDEGGNDLSVRFMNNMMRQAFAEKARQRRDMVRRGRRQRWAW